MVRKVGRETPGNGVMRGWGVWGGTQSITSDATALT